MHFPLGLLAGDYISLLYLFLKLLCWEINVICKFIFDEHQFL